MSDSIFQTDGSPFKVAVQKDFGQMTLFVHVQAGVALTYDTVKGASKEAIAAVVADTILGIMGTDLNERRSQLIKQLGGEIGKQFHLT